MSVAKGGQHEIEDEFITVCSKSGSRQGNIASSNAAIRYSCFHGVKSRSFDLPAFVYVVFCLLVMRRHALAGHSEMENNLCHGE